MKNRAFSCGRDRRSCGGAAVLESVLVMVVLLLILFGFLQLFQLSMARAFADFAAFRAARSASVGFQDYLVQREARIRSIPASGILVEPQGYRGFDSAADQFAFEKSAIPLFSRGKQYLEYDHWLSGTPDLHSNYHCPYYGLPWSSGGSDCVCSCAEGKAAVQVETSRSDEAVKAVFRFRDHPFSMPLREAFFQGDGMDITSEVKLTNHASSILQ